jgi:Protein of unknown function (DUF1353)
MRRSALVFVVCINLVCCGAPAQLLAAKFEATFRGRVITEWLSDGRRMRLLEPFEYVAPDGRTWPVPSGITVDGASIPQVFWSLIGGPFEGFYRGPSVIHDYYCATRARPSEQVHRMFYEAMRTAGVGESKAWLMYHAVARFGPQWEASAIDPRCEVSSPNYDFQHCAKNSARPIVRTPDQSKEALLAFLVDMRGQADPADLATLQQSIERSR